MAVFSWKGTILLCLLQNNLQLLKTLHSKHIINYQKSIALLEAGATFSANF